MPLWHGRVLEAGGGMFTAILTPADHEGPEVVADFDMAQCEVSDVSEGDLFDFTPKKLTMLPPRVWTQAEVNAIRNRARKRARLLRRNVMAG